MTKVFIFDHDHCNGCYGCQFACKDEHCGNEWLPYAKSQPNTGQFWCKVDQIDHGQVPKVRVEYKPSFGGQNPAIAEYAPEVMMERADGIQVIDPEKAKGRKDIADKFEGVFWNEELEIPQACTGCAHLLDEGLLPRCVDFCATGALKFGEAEDFADEIAAAEGEGKVFYLNMPHLFIAGDVWDPEIDEIIEGAKVTLTMPDGSTMETETDDFGDFYFRKIDEGSYKVLIEAEGYQSVEREVELSKSENLGDFPLAKA